MVVVMLGTNINNICPISVSPTHALITPSSSIPSSSSSSFTSPTLASTTLLTSSSTFSSSHPPPLSICSDDNHTVFIPLYDTESTTTLTAVAVVPRTPDSTSTITDNHKNSGIKCSIDNHITSITHIPVVYFSSSQNSSMFSNI
jgi:hypothetical protein